LPVTCVWSDKVQSTMSLDCDWVELYGPLGALSVQDVPKALKVLHDEAQSQLADEEEQAPAWAMLGCDGSYDESKVKMHVEKSLGGF
jgi:hypothetical protein